MCINPFPLRALGVQARSLERSDERWLCTGLAQAKHSLSVASMMERGGIRTGSSGGRREVSLARLSLHGHTSHPAAIVFIFKQIIVVLPSILPFLGFPA